MDVTRQPYAAWSNSAADRCSITAWKINKTDPLLHPASPHRHFYSPLHSCAGMKRAFEPHTASCLCSHCKKKKKKGMKNKGIMPFSIFYWWYLGQSNTRKLHSVFTFNDWKQRNINHIDFRLSHKETHKNPIKTFQFGGSEVPLLLYSFGFFFTFHSYSIEAGFLLILRQ